MALIDDIEIKRIINQTDNFFNDEMQVISRFLYDNDKRKIDLSSQEFITPDNRLSQAMFFRMRDISFSFYLNKFKDE